MLYDPKWEVKADPRSLESFIAWLEKHPADAEYEYCDPWNCLIAQWLLSMGETHYNLCSYQIDALFDGNGRQIVLNGGNNQTFGAALERARKVAASR